MARPILDYTTGRSDRGMSMLWRRLVFVSVFLLACTWGMYGVEIAYVRHSWPMAPVHGVRHWPTDPTWARYTGLACCGLAVAIACCAVGASARAARWLAVAVLAACFTSMLLLVSYITIESH